MKLWRQKKILKITVDLFFVSVIHLQWRLVGRMLGGAVEQKKGLQKITYSNIFIIINKKQYILQNVEFPTVTIGHSNSIKYT